MKNFLISSVVASSLCFVPLSAALACGGGTATEAGDKTPAKAGTIVDTAAKAGIFKTLLAAATAAGLVETLSGAGPLTVFAPSDEAFAKLPKGTVEALLQDKEKLRAILTYHVVAGAVMSKDAVKLSQAKTVQGQNLRLAVVGGKLMIDNATVVTADVVASNGVIHIIDSVLMPTTP